MTALEDFTDFESVLIEKLLNLEWVGGCFSSRQMISNYINRKKSKMKNFA